MKNRYPLGARSFRKQLSVAAAVLACGIAGLAAQDAPSSQDVQALVAEIGDLKTRLAAVEAKLASYPPSASLVASVTKPVTEAHPPTPTPTTPTASTTNNPPHTH